jgi:hypothetical protein
MRLKIFDIKPGSNDPPTTAQQQLSPYDIQSLLGPWVQFSALYVNYPVLHAVRHVKVHSITRFAATNKSTSAIAHCYCSLNNRRSFIFSRQSYLDIFAPMETAYPLPPRLKEICATFSTLSTKHCN